MAITEFEGTLVYSEFDEKAGPVIRALYPDNLLYQIYSVKGPPIRVRARVIQENELPVYYTELGKDLGRL